MGAGENEFNVVEDGIGTVDSYELGFAEDCKVGLATSTPILAGIPVLASICTREYEYFSYSYSQVFMRGVQVRDVGKQILASTVLVGMYLQVLTSIRNDVLPWGSLCM